MLSSDAICIETLNWRCPSEVASLMVSIPGFIWLDSAQGNLNSARYSILAADPFESIEFVNGKLTINGEHNNQFILDYLDLQLQKYAIVNRTDLPLLGGALGYLSYEFSKYLETLPTPKNDPLAIPDAMMGLYDALIIVCHKTQKLILVSTGFPYLDSVERLQRAQTRMTWLKSLVHGPCMLPAPVVEAGYDLVLDDPKEDYKDKVKQVLEYIRAGDIFEANFTTRFSATVSEELDSFSLYLALRKANGGPFSAYLKAPNFEILSVSPERFIAGRRQKLSTYPIKGTRKRSDDPLEDDRLAQELSESEKDRAENIMIVDLMRNDFSRVCQSDSVEVKSLCEVHRFKTVHHLVSHVAGTLKDDKSLTDVIRCCFPAGSITGAPKIRSMEIIAELEPSVRGAYCGSMLYLGFDGSLDSSVMIRTVTRRGQRISLGAGGAVVIDSDPEDEYNEAIAKARGVLSVMLKDRADL